MSYVCHIVYYLVWPFAYLIIILCSKKSEMLNKAANAVLNVWKQALVIAGICWLSGFIGTLNPKYLLAIPATIDTFCIVSFGLALAAGIRGFEPLPVMAVVSSKSRPVKNIVLMLVFTVITAVAAIILSSFGSSFIQALVCEKTGSEAVNSIPGANKYLSFFTLLSGAGLAEEVPYRLFFLTLFWRLTKKPYLAVILSAIAFGLYHLTPINNMYLIYWHYPVAQFSHAFLAGLVFGFIYIKRGFETSVLGHTLSDWIAVLLTFK